MMRISRKLSAFLSLLILCAGAALGQTAEVTHNVNLRSDPSTANPPIRLLLPPEQVQLVEAGKTNGYFHVRTVQNEEGWVWSSNVHLLPVTPTAAPTPSGPTATPAAGITPSPPPTPSGIATVIQPSWPKGTPVEVTFSGASGTCGPDGDPSGDTETNHLKNRVDEPTSTHEVTWAAIKNLPVPHVKTTRKSWKTADRTLAAAEITPFEGVALTVTGFIVNKVKLENGGEGTNCGFTLNPEIDWHIPLVEHPNDPEKLSIVVETTPRVRKNHPSWTPTALTPWVNATNPVRISGWLMFDPDHPPMVYDPAHPNAAGKYRITLWEIHPITKIEVWKNGAWVALESLP
jgi:uncharacterized protein YraI